ncbi:MAG TPA: hypothetical protein PLT78_14150 [Ignavibacteriaceae bacterium]|nr:hypothetical protein [Ignavibacteriaceae bacterium]
MTNELSRRIYEHKNGLVDGFTKNSMLINWFISNYKMILNLL